MPPTATLDVPPDYAVPLDLRLSRLTPEPRQPHDKSPTLVGWAALLAAVSYRPCDCGGLDPWCVLCNGWHIAVEALLAAIKPASPAKTMSPLVRTVLTLLPNLLAATDLRLLHPLAWRCHESGRTAAHDHQRAWASADWVTRVTAAQALHALGIRDQPDALRGLAPLTPDSERNWTSVVSNLRQALGASWPHYLGAAIRRRGALPGVPDDDSPTNALVATITRAVERAVADSTTRLPARTQPMPARLTVAAALALALRDLKQSNGAGSARHPELAAAAPDAAAACAVAAAAVKLKGTPASALPYKSAGIAITARLIGFIADYMTSEVTQAIRRSPRTHPRELARQVTTHAVHQPLHLARTRTTTTFPYALGADARDYAYALIAGSAQRPPAG